MTKKPGRKIITFDWAIKTVLRDKANFDVLEGFLTALFGRSITILDLLESESNQRDEADKYNRVDLLAKAGDGERIIVEVQYLPEKAYLKRLAPQITSTSLNDRDQPIDKPTENNRRSLPCAAPYGAAKTVVENIQLGEPYDNVTKVYSVSLLYFDISKDHDDYIYHGKTEFTGLHTRRLARLKEFLVGEEVHINRTNVFPEYYLIPLRAFPDVIRDELDQWVYAFKNNEVLDEFTAPGIGALKEKFDYLKMDEKERRRFDRHVDYARSEWGMIAYAREKGREEGREEERKILVGSLHKNGMSIPVIAASIGFPEALIRRWLEEG